MFTVIERLRALRIVEGLSEVEFAKELDIPYVYYSKCEHEVHELTTEDYLKISKHPRFEKYTLWLLSGKTAPDVGQVAPSTDSSNSWMDGGRDAATGLQAGRNSADNR